MNYRTEHDSMGEIAVPADKYWGAQTQRSLNNFKIGSEKMPAELIRAIAVIKKACAVVNNRKNPHKMTDEKKCAIAAAADRIIAGDLDDNFPLSVWQTGSGTQTNMNVNEVIANFGNEYAGKKLLHPNDDVNMSQSSNDVFPSAIHVAALYNIENRLLPSLSQLTEKLLKLEQKNGDVLKIGRTHLMDATPMLFSQEISGWRSMTENAYKMIVKASDELRYLALGGTAIGTGICSPRDFGKDVCKELSALTNIRFEEADNKFYALTSKDALVFAHGALSGLASDLWKIANDVRMLASGPRCGLGEITIPSNEPGSSIMPGKVNPTQCEAITMVSLQVHAGGNLITTAASQGNFQLNVFMPVIAYNFLNSVRLLTDVINSFGEKCIDGIKPNVSKMNENLERSLMLITALSPEIGYENAARAAKYAFDNNITLKESCRKLNLISDDRYDSIIRPENMTCGY